MKQPSLLAVALLLGSSVCLGQDPSFSIPRSNTINARQLLRDLRILSADDMQGRLVGTPGSAKARKYIVRRFKQSGVKSFGASYLRPFEFSDPERQSEKHHGVNVVGYIRGKQTPEKCIVITAHYDHLGVINGEVYNGADDNASGTAALFTLAAYFTKHRSTHSLIFAAFDDEEDSGAGGLRFVAEPPVKKEAIVMNVNVDAISRERHNILYAVGTHHYPFLKPYLENIVSQVSVKLLLGHDNPNDSDSEDWTELQDGATFHRDKIPFVYFGVEGSEHNHQPTDDYENITPAFYVRAVEAIIAALRQFDSHLAEIEILRAQQGLK